MSEERVNPESQKNKNWNLKALATNPDRIYEKKLKLEGTQIELTDQQWWSCDGGLKAKALEYFHTQ